LRFRFTSIRITYITIIYEYHADTILQGAAVAILETHNPTTPRTEVVKGLARIVQVSPTLALFDITIRGLSPGTYQASIRETGDISNGAISTKGIWDSPLPSENEEKNGNVDVAKMKRGVLGTVNVGKDGVGAVFVDKPIQIWEMIGRGFVVSKLKEGEERIEKNDEDTLVGVIARSAGVWDNDKTVCSCSGKTLWEERKEERGKGML
jgi:copper chaperone for superoxide dismutase